MRTKKAARPPMPCTGCGGAVTPNDGPITLVPWRCAKCTTLPKETWRKS